MDSIPEQHLGSLPNGKREEVYRQIGMVCAFRSERLPEDEVAQKAKFRSVEDMYFRLKRWGLSGLVPMEKEALSDTSAPEEASGRQLRALGPITELPPASAAIPLFREKLEELGRANEDLKHRKEKRQGKHFTHSAIHTTPASIYGDEMWERLLADNGLEGVTRMSSDVRTWELGRAGGVPATPLPELIGMYLLAGGEVESLVKLLHDKGSKVNWPKIEELIEGRSGQELPGEKRKARQDGIKRVAEQLATLIRGSVREGRTPDSETADNIDLACRITDGRDAGMSDQDIFEKLRSNPMLKKELTWKEFCRLRDLNCRWPFQ